MKRFFEWVKAIFGRGMDKLEDPEIMLDQARRDMNSALVANREKAIQAISQRNQLQMMNADAVKKSQQLEAQATTALKQGNRDLALQFMREKTNNDTVVAQLQESLDQASATVEQVKTAIKRQEEEVRKKTAEALAMKAQWKNAQIQNSIAKALEGLTFENQYENSFAAAGEKIRRSQSEASARNEMMGNSLMGKAWELQNQTADLEAETQLQALEARISGTPSAATSAVEAAPQQVQVGLNGAPPPDTGPAAPDPAAAKSEAEKQLEELEKRMKGE